MPGGPGVRVDTAIQPGERVPPEYDNLIAKLMVHAADRDQAVDRLRRALDEVEISGIQTTLPFHRFVARHPAFRAADLSTGWVAEHWDPEASQAAAARIAQVAAVIVTPADGVGPLPASARDPHEAGTLDPGPGGHTPPAGWSRNGAWRRAGLEAATDRWPR